MGIVHIVLFHFKASAPQEAVKAACQKMIALKDTCVHPTSGKAYVKSYGGGRDISPEGKSGGFTHGFVSEFENKEDRDYYLDKDPAHLEFKNCLKDIIEDVRVIDYTPGEV